MYSARLKINHHPLEPTAQRLQPQHCSVRSQEEQGLAGSAVNLDDRIPHKNHTAIVGQERLHMFALYKPVVVGRRRHQVSRALRPYKNIT